MTLSKEVIDLIVNYKEGKDIPDGQLGKQVIDACKYLSDQCNSVRDEYRMKILYDEMKVSGYKVQTSSVRTVEDKRGLVERVLQTITANEFIASSCHICIGQLEEFWNKNVKHPSLHSVCSRYLGKDERNYLKKSSA